MLAKNYFVRRHKSFLVQHEIISETQNKVIVSETDEIH